ncbi:O-methyltransferase [Kineococcus rhizosphaerae]|uniref:Putative O-methyltransferase YrrM n=1 Tax=Kineococcus rhizosphaerae TaxID=559628 RepID=A0A2T0R485_9ACTN|nr:O-methyltransferase [Kineococcus rhizosphaerae]PRY15154.1 putative O-methyltransferase YrrM [Kineococcus rhizosphaerae]
MPTSSSRPTSKQPASWAYAEQFVPEDDVLQRARERAADLDLEPVSPGVAATLTVLTAAGGARTVVEVGTGTGVSLLSLLRGMGEDGVVTTIDSDGEAQRAAREAVADDGIRTNRARFINGRALEVLPRLTDGAYDLVLLDGDEREYSAYLEQAHRLLRVGGVLVVDDALFKGRVVDPAVRDTSTVALREVARVVLEDGNWFPTLLPSGDGLLVAVKHS